MSAELHPEEALDRVVAGALSEHEERLLEQHLAQCKACRLQLALTRAARAPQAAYASDGRSNSLAIEAALARLERRRWPVLANGRRWAWLGAASLLVLGGVASAAWRHRARVGSVAGVTPGVVEVGRRLSTFPVSTSAVPSASAATAPPGLAPPELTGVPAHPADLNRAREAPPTAAALFEQASALRSSNRPGPAIAAFRRLQQLYPGSRESHLSFALAGRLLLQRGQDSEAVAQFDHYLVQGGAAAEEALAGRAAALEQLGRSAAEASTWQRLLRAYPSSVYAGQARARLAQISQTSARTP